MNELPPELVQKVFFFSDRSSRFEHGLVCHAWYDLTIHAWRAANQHDLKNFICSFTNLVFFNSLQPELEKIEKSFSALPNDSLTTPEQIDQSFWNALGKTLDVLRRMPPKDILKDGIDLYIPHSINHLFAVANLTLVQALEDRDEDIFEVAKTGNICMLSVLRFEPKNVVTATVVATLAWENKKQKCVQWLLATGQVSRLDLTMHGILAKDIELVRFLQDKGSIGDIEHSMIVQASFEKKELEIARVLLVQRPIKNDVLVIPCIRKSIEMKSPELIPLLLADASTEESNSMFHFALLNVEFEVAQAILDVRPLSETTFSSQDWGVLLQNPNLENKCGTIRFLINHNKLLFSDLLPVILWTIKHDPIEVTKVILDLLPLTVSERTKLANWAIQKGKFGLVQLFLAHGPVNVLSVDSLLWLSGHTFDANQRSTLQKLLLEQNYWSVRILQALKICIPVTLVALAILVGNRVGDKILQIRLRGRV
jgi:hypothetical protein